MKLSRRTTDTAVGVGIVVLVVVLAVVTVCWAAAHPTLTASRITLGQTTKPDGPRDDAPPPTVLPPPPSSQPPATPSQPPTSPTTPPTSATQPTPAIDCTKIACVALTFDDGPGLYTNQLLDILAEKSTPATFFLVGNMVVNRPAVVARIQAEGHAIGNHSYSHPHFAGQSVAWVTDQIQRASDAIVAAGGAPPQLLRPPYGDRGAAITQAETNLGLMQVLWNVDPSDWRDRDAPLIVQRVVTAATAGSIILLHDIHPTTVEAVPQIIDQLRAKGFTLVTVPQLIGGITPGRSVSAGPHP